MQQNIQQSGPVSPIIITTTAAMRIAKGNATIYEKALMARNDVWHKIDVFRGGTMDKELVLQSILQAVQPIDLIPVRYTNIGEDSYFLIRNCDNALQQLCRLNLIIKAISGELLLLTITLGYASIHDLKMNIRPLLLALLTKRYQHGKRTLNLDSFHRDPEITETVYCPLSLPRTLSSVLNIAIKDLSNFDCLCLRNNELSCLSGMESMKLNNTSLDLRNNLLLNADCLSPLKDMNITELWLDGNPLCENYSTVERYIHSIRKYCPNLVRLDGIYIGSPGLPISYNNYVPIADREKLLRQFARHFFSLFDGADKTSLRGLYHAKAFYSLSLDTTFAARLKKSWMNKNTKHNSVAIIAENAVSDSEKIIPQAFAAENRNLMNEKCHGDRKLYFGSDNVVRGLRHWPVTQHYPDSFMYNLMYDSGTYVCFAIDGVFRDVVSNENFVFNRTFVLMNMESDEFRIVNDQCLVFCTSIKELKLEEEITNNCYTTVQSGVTKFPTLDEKMKMVKYMKHVTKLREVFCQQFLEKADWNLRNAIINFVDQYKAMCIPTEAFT